MDDFDMMPPSPHTYNMASAQKVLCCKDTRWGTMLCGFYTTAMAILCISLYLIRYIGFSNVHEPPELRVIAYLSFVIFTFLFFISIVLIAGAYLDRRLLFLPWMVFMICSMIVELGTMTTMVVVQTKNRERLGTYDLAILAVWMVRILLNTYSICCVAVQYGKLSKGKGTYEYYKRKRRRRRIQRMMIQSTINAGFTMDELNIPHPEPSPFPPPYCEDPPPYAESETEDDNEGGGTETEERAIQNSSPTQNEAGDLHNMSVTAENEVTVPDRSAQRRTYERGNNAASPGACPRISRRDARARQDRLPRDLQRISNLLASEDNEDGQNNNANGPSRHPHGASVSVGPRQAGARVTTSAAAAAAGSAPRRPPPRRPREVTSGSRSVSESEGRRRTDRNGEDGNRRREIQVLPENLREMFRQWVGN